MKNSNTFISKLWLKHRKITINLKEKDSVAEQENITKTNETDTESQLKFMTLDLPVFKGMNYSLIYF